MKPSAKRIGILSWRRWMQFRLRAVLLLLVACCVAFAWARFRIDSYRRQHAAFATIGQYSNYVATTPGRPKWLRFVADPSTFSDIHHVSFHAQGKLTDRDLEQLRHLPRLRRLSLHGTSITDDGLKHLSQLHELDTLSLKSTRIGDEGLRHLVGLKKLRMLQLSDSKVTRGGVRFLTQLPSLEILEISHVMLEDGDVRQMSSLTHLQTLEFCAGKLTTKGFGGISAIKGLRELRLCPPMAQDVQLKSLPKLTQVHLWAGHDVRRFQLSLEDLPSLTQLDLRTPRFDGLSIRNLPRLRSLTVQYSRLNEKVLQELGNHEVLTSLSFSQSTIPPSGIQHLARLPDLKSLDLCSTGIRDEDLEFLASIGSLESLNISRNPIYGKGLRYLSSLTRLKELNIADTRISGHPLEKAGRSSDLTQDPFFGEVFPPRIAFEHISRLTTLESLDLGGIPVAKEELLLLENLPNLKTIQVDTRRLNNKDFAEVLKALPIIEPVESSPGRLFLQGEFGGGR